MPVTANFDFFKSLHIELKAEMERAWVERLYKEHELLCFQYSLKLSKPVIELFDSESVWGTWDPVLRRIQISRSLIESASWENVLGILKHEMAHQIVSEFFGKNHHHDETFRKACDLIAVPESFRKSAVRVGDGLRHWRDDPRDEEGARLLRKAEKLLALAESANEHEAYLAMEKVNALFKKYNIERTRTECTQDYVRLVINHKKKRIERTQSLICSILANHYFVRVIYSEMFDAQDLEAYKTLELFGSRENVLMAEYVYHFLSHRLQALWSEYQRRENAPQQRKASYQIGLLTGFRDKLDKTTAPKKENDQQKEEVSLLCLGEKQLDRFVKTHYPKLSTRSQGSRTVDAASFADGKADGRKITIHKGIHDKGKRGTLLLGR